MPNKTELMRHLEQSLYRNFQLLLLWSIQIPTQAKQLVQLTPRACHSFYVTLPTFSPVLLPKPTPRAFLDRPLKPRAGPELFVPLPWQDHINVHSSMPTLWRTGLQYTLWKAMLNSTRRISRHKLINRRVKGSQARAMLDTGRATAGNKPD